MRLEEHLVHLARACIIRLPLTIWQVQKPARHAGVGVANELIVVRQERLIELQQAAEMASRRNQVRERGEDGRCIGKDVIFEFGKVTHGAGLGGRD